MALSNPMRPDTLKLFLGTAALVTGAAGLSAFAADRPAPASPPAAAAKTPMPEQARFFEAKVRPVLLERCGACHGEKLQQSGLRLDSADALLKGGKGGPAVVPGSPEKSLLLRAIRHAEGVAKMPPTGKLPEDEIAALESWVRQGAFWPQYSGKVTARGGHWAFQPVKRPAVPAVKDRAWMRTPIDAFVLAELEKKGLRPSPPADRRTLIRRATFDLTGLPPTPEEVEAFVADRSPAAWAKVVDRLLASPHYGEKWGRHWLDVARYADSNGMDENVHYGNAWRYRDYVVDSLNQDVPFDRFIVEQLAGDLLPAGDNPTRHRQLIATGFIAVGPKLISEVDTRKMEMDMVDEQLDTTGRTFMGLTLGCARCHDHKFDPVSQADYYALAGIFKSTKTIQVTTKPRMWFEYPIPGEADLARKKAHDEQVSAQKQAVAGLVAAETEKLKSALRAGEALPANPEAAFPEAARAELKRLREAVAALEKNPPALPMAMGVTEGTVDDLPIHKRGSFLELGEVVPRRFPAILAGQQQPAFDKSRSGRLELARWIASPENPLTGRVFVNRVWRWHFGRGIVPSTDNFGFLGDKPSHPALLDWLAATFTSPAEAGGQAWSLKRLHRLILLSSTYQQSSAPSAGPHQADPENRLLWRAPIRRLEAEEVRDSLLFTAGQLDLKLGGTLITLKNREYFFDHTSKDLAKYDSRRRSLYLPIVRNNLYDVFQLFDFGDAQVPEGNRPTTTVAPQALFMLNSDLVQDAARGMADRLRQEAADPDTRIRKLYARAYGRLPTAREASRARELLARFAAASGETDAAKREQDAWSWLAQVALASNEFIYLR